MLMSAEEAKEESYKNFKQLIIYEILKSIQDGGNKITHYKKNVSYESIAKLSAFLEKKGYKVENTYSHFIVSWK